jgi:hypothetical protein
MDCSGCWKSSRSKRFPPSKPARQGIRTNGGRRSIASRPAGAKRYAAGFFGRLLGEGSQGRAPLSCPRDKVRAGNGGGLSIPRIELGITFWKGRPQTLPICNTARSRRCFIGWRGVLSDRIAARGQRKRIIALAEPWPRGNLTLAGNRCENEIHVSIRRLIPYPALGRKAGNEPLLVCDGLCTKGRSS